MKLKRSVKLFLISVALTALLFGIAGCSEKNSGKDVSKSTQGQSTNSSSSSSKQERPKLLKMGEKATVGDYEVTILSAKNATEYVNGPGEGNKYIVIRCSFKNISKEEKRTAIGSSLQWVGADGTRKGYASTTGVKMMKSKDKLAPGESGEYEEVYKVPKDKNEFEFHYVTMKPIELARWQVTVN